MYGRFDNKAKFIWAKPVRTGKSFPKINEAVMSPKPYGPTYGPSY